jgi:hypothetical protein
MKASVVVAFVLLACLALSACAPGMNEERGKAGTQGVVSGFWRGLWHGIISPVTLIISLFNSKVQMYEVHNNGGWYNFGFLLGMIVIFGGGARGSAARRRRD